MRAIHTATLLSLAILAGCSAQPKAFYETPPAQGTEMGKDESYQGDWEGLPKFTLAKSQLVVDFKDKEKQPLPQMISVPAEAQPEPAPAGKPNEELRTRFMLRQDDTFGVDTHLNVSKIDNTDLLSSIGTEVEDKRVKYVGALGSLVTGVIGALALTDGTDLPISIDSYQMLKDNEVGRGKKDAYAIVTAPNKTQIHLHATFGPIKDDAIDNSVFARKAQIQAQETIFHSACRSVTIRFDDGPLEGQQFSATVADPRYVETVKFPEKGSVVFHSACGANTTSSPSGTSSTLDVVNAVIAQYKTVREAWVTSKSTKETSDKAAAKVAADKKLAAQEKADAKAKAAGKAPAGR